MNSSKRNVVIALMVTTFLTAMESTIVSTATATIVRDLGGTHLVSWVFSLYMLTMAVTTPIYGKMADLFGRKRVFISGTSLFLVGSFLCGISGSMTQLLVFRGLQGLGAGAVQPMTMTIIGDVFSKEERAKFMGLFSAMWGVAGIVGPLIGGFLVDNISWHWIFYINIPIGIVAIYLIMKFFHEQITPRKVKIDYLGATLFTLSIGTVLYTLLVGGEGGIQNWDSNILLLLAGSLVFFWLFLRVEKRAEEPILPLPLFKRPLVAVSVMISFVQGAVLIGSTAYLPLWLQNVQGHSATFAGLTLLPMSIGWLLSSSIGGRWMLKKGYKPVVVCGMTVLVISSVGLALITPTTPVWWLPLIIFFLGIGFGFSTTAVTIAVQSSVVWQQRGIATGSIQFTRTVGQTVGVAILGAVLNYYLVAGGATATAEGLMSVFVGMLVIAIMGMLVSLFLPQEADDPEEELVNSRQMQRSGS